MSFSQAQIFGKVVPVDCYQRSISAKLWKDSSRFGWPQVTIRGLTFGAMKGDVVEVPPIDSYIVILRTAGQAHIRRVIDGQHQAADVEPGDITLHTLGAGAKLHWNAPLQCIQIYPSSQIMAQVGAELFDLPPAALQIRNELKVRDEHLARIARAVVTIADTDEPGARLHVEALVQQLCTWLLRHYAEHILAEPRRGGRLRPEQQRMLEEYILVNFNQDLGLDELAGVVGVTRSHFGRIFVSTYGITPHQYVLAQRLEAARHMVVTTKVPVALIASATGFGSQSHLTRAFRRRFDITPTQIRRG